MGVGWKKDFGARHRLEAQEDPRVVSGLGGVSLMDSSTTRVATCELDHALGVDLVLDDERGL